MLISHTAFREYQKKPLTVHLKNVASECAVRVQRLSLSTRLITKDDLAGLAYRIGLFHDLGKASSHFQKYIRGGPRLALTNHSLISAVILYYDLTESDRWKEFAILGFKAVQRHHGNLSAFGTEDLDNGALAANTLRIYADIRDQILRDEDLRGFIELNSVALPELSREKLCELGRDLEEIGPYENPDDAIERFLIQNLLFSVLIDADKYDAARITSRPDQTLDEKVSYSPHAYLQGMRPEDNDLNRIRGELLNSAQRAASLSSGGRCFAMSAPTGSGKTLACLGFAEAVQNTLPRPRRVIYCLPYTSIIDQNYDVMEKVLETNGLDADNPELLLKHHHLVDFSRQNPGENYDYHDYLNDNLIADSWNAACVISTFVQFFHSLIGSRNSLVRKLHNMINSIVLLDEVQSLPPKYYPLLRRIFAVLSQRFDTHILTCTATQPFIFEPGSYAEISPPELFDHPIFNRVRLHVHQEKISLEDFAEDLDLGHAENALFVMNTKRSALKLYELLKKRFQDSYGVFCLTTLHTPRCRLERIQMVREALAEKKRIILVSTQLIEAGVDLSFCRVYRDMGPLDSVVQVAGRCNRHGELGILGGEMHLLQLAEDDREYCLRVYDAYLIQKTRELLRGHETLESQDFPALIQDYYQNLEFGAEAKALLRSIGELNYDLNVQGERPIADFRLIEDQYAVNSLYVILDEESQKAMDDLLSAREELRDPNRLTPDRESQARLRIRRAYHSLAQCQVTLRDSELKNYNTVMSYFNQLDDHIFYVNFPDVGKIYSPETGFMPDPRDMGSVLSL